MILRREQREVFGCADARACITDFLVGGDQWRGKVARIRMLIDAAACEAGETEEQLGAARRRRPPTDKRDRG